ncbi:MAG: MFS transporter, partial [Actinomycetota bacterium]|nr:MFS transporter [Actinomycetota bacterium]
APGASPSLFTPAFIALFGTELAYFTAAGLLIPLTPLFAAGPLGADEGGVGITVGAFSVTALILRPFAGRQADRRGRRPQLIWGALLCAAAIAAHAFTTDLAMLVFLRLVLGVAEAFFFVAGFAMVADLAPSRRAGEALSFNSLALYLGIAFGPLLGEVLLDTGGFTLGWIGGSALALAAGLLAVAIPERWTPVPDDQVSPPLIHRAAIGPSVGLFTGVAGMAGFLAFVALYARDLGMDGSRLVLLTFGLIVVGCRVVFAKLPDRVPPYRLAAFALALIAIGLVGASVVQTVQGLIAGAAIMAVGVAFTTPAFFTAIVKRVPAHERGAALGTTSIFLDLAFGGGPMLLGFVAGAAGIPVAFTAAAAIAAAGALGTGFAAVGRRGVAAAT